MDSALSPKADPEELAQKERQAARRVELGAAGYVLGGVLAVYLVALFCPQVTGVRGWQVLAVTAESRAQGLKITEYVFSWLAFLGIGVLTTITVLTRRTAAALVAWMLVTVAVAFSLLSMWLRLQRPGVEEHVTAQVGYYLMIAAVIVACGCYSMTALRRSPEQERIARARAQAPSLDPVARAQAESLGSTRSEAAGEDNPLFIDDRRMRAHERARRRAGRSED